MPRRYPCIGWLWGAATLPHCGAATLPHRGAATLGAATRALRPGRGLEGAPCPHSLPQGFPSYRASIIAPLPRPVTSLGKLLNPATEKDESLLRQNCLVMKDAFRQKVNADLRHKK